MRWVHANDGMELEAAVLAEHDVTNHHAGFFDNAQDFGMVGLKP